GGRIRSPYFPRPSLTAPPELRKSTPSGPDARREDRMAGTIEARLAELGIELPKAAAPAANYVPWVVSGNTVYVAGQITVWNGEFRFQGKVGQDFSVEEGYQAA